MPRTLKIALAAVASAAALAPSAQAALPAPITTLASRPPGFGPLGPGTENDTIAHDVSADGRHVVLISCADGLMTGDDDRSCGIYRRDRVAGTTVLVSTLGDEEVEAQIDDAGQAIAFATRSALVPADTNGRYDVYRWQLGVPGFELVSRTPGGAAGDDESYDPRISADGTAVGFTSEASNLVSPAPAVSQAYVRKGATLAIVSRVSGAGGAPVADRAYLTSLSADGTAAAFVTETGLAGVDDANGEDDVYVRHGTTTTLASGYTGAGGDTGADEASGGLLSANGRRVAFETGAQVIPGVPPGIERVYVRDLDTHTVTLASRETGAGGAVPTAYSEVVGISGDGTKVLFETTAALDPADVPALGLKRSDLYLRDLTASTTQMASRAPDLPPSDLAQAGIGALSADGATVVFAARPLDLAPALDPDFQQVFAKSLPSGALAHVDEPAAGFPLRGEMHHAGSLADFDALSADGTRLAFTHQGNAISPEDDDAGEQGYVRVLATGENLLVTRADGPSGAAVPASGGVSDVVVSADGTKAAFSLQNASFDPADTMPAYSVYVRDLVTGKTTFAGQGNPASQCFVAGIDGDGSKVSMRCLGLDLLGEGNGKVDMYVRDLETGQTVLASRGDGPAGAIGNQDSNGGGSFSADGRYVTFESAATNFEGGGEAVYVRDLVEGRTILVSRANGAAGAPIVDAGGMSDAGISADGRRVAFTTTTEVTADDTVDARDLYVRDLGAGTTTLASPRVGGVPGGANDRVDGAALSKDGSTVAFGVELAGGQQVRGYVRELGSGAVTLVTRATGPDGAVAEEDGDDPQIAIDATGACAAFDSNARNVDPFPATSDFTRQVYVRGACGVPAGGPGPGGGGAGGGGGAQPGPVADRVAPVVRGAKLSRTVFAVGDKPTALASASTAGGTRRNAKRTPKGTTLSFRLSETATVGVAVERRTRGRRSGRACVKSTKRLVRRKAKRCWRHTGVATLTRAGLKAGSQRLALSGRFGRRKLAAGSYRLVLVARDAAGNRSKPVTLAFTIRSR